MMIFGASGSQFSAASTAGEPITSVNRARAAYMAQLVRGGQAVTIIHYRDRGRACVYMARDPRFTAAMEAGSYPADKLATAYTFLDDLCADGELQQCAARQGITVESWQEMIEYERDRESDA